MTHNPSYGLPHPSRQGARVWLRGGTWQSEDEAGGWSDAGEDNRGRRLRFGPVLTEIFITERVQWSMLDHAPCTSAWIPQLQKERLDHGAVRSGCTRLCLPETSVDRGPRRRHRRRGIRSASSSWVPPRHQSGVSRPSFEPVLVACTGIGCHSSQDIWPESVSACNTSDSQS